MSWLSTLAQRYDHVRGRFEAFEVDNETDRTHCLAVLDKVRAEELNRVHGSSTLETAAFADRKVKDRLFGIRDSRNGTVIGCIRQTSAAELSRFEGSRAEYRLDIIPPEIRNKTTMLSRLAILKEYRKSLAALSLFSRLADDALEAGDLAILLSCEPGLYAGYLRLGFRPFGRVHQGSSGGFRVPMIAIVHDVEHAIACRSPLAGRLKNWTGDAPDTAIRWFRHFQAEEGTIDPGIAFFSADKDKTIHAQLTRGMTERGRAELLKNAMEIDCSPGDYVVKAQDGGRFMGFVISGIVEVHAKDQVVAILGEGELFGEMAVVLDTNRSADVVAAVDGTRVMTLSRNCIARLGRQSDRLQLWQNFAKVLALRLSSANE
jgi:hypothetical protein